MKSLRLFVIFIVFLFLMSIITACSGGSGFRTTTASQVKDERTLREFVLDARHYLEKDYERAIKDFKKEGQWRYRGVYLFIVDERGKLILYVPTPSLEGQRNLLIKDVRTGRVIVDDLLRKGLQQGGGFVEYHIDDPTTDRRDVSRKITYVTSFRRSRNSPILIIGSGFFPSDY